jgi:hypothetical protein
LAPQVLAGDPSWELLGRWREICTAGQSGPIVECVTFTDTPWPLVPEKVNVPF